MTRTTGPSPPNAYAARAPAPPTPSSPSPAPTPSSPRCTTCAATARWSSWPRPTRPSPRWPGSTVPAAAGGPRTHRLRTARTAGTSALARVVAGQPGRVARRAGPAARRRRRGRAPRSRPARPRARRRTADLRLESAVVADSSGAESVAIDALLAAAPDPFQDVETVWLQHLEEDHADLVEMLARRLPSTLRTGRVRPLGIDRYGVRLRIEGASGDHDVRLDFTEPVGDAMALSRRCGSSSAARS